MINVFYLPAGELGPFENGSREKSFETSADFKEWVRSYVCSSCLKDFRDFTGKEAKTIMDYLSMGCGCEIFVEDYSDLIDWDEDMND